MATLQGGTSKDNKGKKPHRNKLTGKKYMHYTIEGGKISRGRFCPRCGPGVFLAKHKDRICCGKCHYTEFTVKD